MDNISDWFQHLNCAITVCDRNGTIVYMNQKAQRTFEKHGGAQLIGTSMYNCHKPRSQEIIDRLMKEGSSNTYTIEKNGVKKIIYQTPWYSEGTIAGLIEFSIEIPFEIPHHNRN